MTRESSLYSDDNKPRLVLASASPRRSALLSEMGLEFDVLSTDIDESIGAGETPKHYVLRLAQQKAQAAKQILSVESKVQRTILAADTIVCRGDDIFGKPKDKNDAMQIWSRLSDSEHEVMTGVSLLADNTEHSCIAKSQIRFDVISEAQMHAYWQSGEPVDKAGAYAIQGIASAWVQQLSGSYSNVVGLPLYEVNAILKNAGLNWL